MLTTKLGGLDETQTDTDRHHGWNSDRSGSVPRTARRTLFAYHLSFRSTGNVNADIHTHIDANLYAYVNSHPYTYVHVDANQSASPTWTPSRNSPGNPNAHAYQEHAYT